MSGLCQLAGGDLAVSPLAAVLLEALRARATGVLEIEARGGTSRIYFRGGHPAAAQVFFGFKSLGQFLLELGWIDIVGLERSLSAVAAGQRQGQSLVELGLLSEEQLHLGLVLHHQAQLRTLAGLEEGTYRFQPGPDLPDWTRDLKMSAHRAIVDALTVGPGPRVAARILAQVPDRHGLVLREGWERAAGQFELDAWEERFVGRLVRPQPLDAAIASAPVPPEKARALSACFALMGLVRPMPLPVAPVAPPAPPPPPAPAPEPPAGLAVGFGKNVVQAPPPAGPLDYVTPGPVPFDPFADGFAVGAPPPLSSPARETTPPPSPESTAERDRRLRAVQERELEEFERARKAAEEETRRIRAEEEEQARKAREAALSRPPPEFKSDAATARARRARMLRRAFGAIPGAPERLRGVAEDGTDRTARSGTPGPARSGATPGPGTPGPRTPGPRTPGPGTPGPAAQAGPPLGKELTALAGRILARHRAIADEDYFRRLGIARSTGREGVKRAFFEAAKLYHPDRVPPELAHLTREMKEIFTAVNEAYEVLQDEERRKAYEATLDGGDALPSVDAQLRGLIGVAENAMRHRAFADAERAYRQAATLRERPDLLARAAWAILSDPARRDDAPRARTELAALAASYPKYAEPHFFLGVVARREGDVDRAERHFRDALKANPKHAETAQELRVLSAKTRGTHGR